MNHMRILRQPGMRVLLALVGLSAPVIAVAQVPDSVAADSARKLRAVEVTGSRAVGTAGGASAVIVKPTELRTSPAPLLEQALRESPFVHVRQNSRGEMEISVRGSDSRQAAVMLDGVPVSLGWDHRVDPSLVPLTGAQNLTIVRGLSSVLTGPNTLGGTIEVSYDDAFARLGSGRVWGGAGIDEHAAYVASLGGGRELGTRGAGTLALRGGFAHRQRDGFSLADDVPDPTATHGLRTNSDLRETDAFAIARFNGAMGRSFGALVSAFQAERGVPPEEHIASPRLWRYPHNRRAVVALSGNAGTFATPLGYGAAEAGIGYNAGQLKIQGYSDRTYQTVTGTELGDERTLTARTKLSHTLPMDARIAGALTFANVGYRETLDDATANYQQRLWSAGAEVEQPLGGSSALSAGVVYDRAETPETGGRAPQPSLGNLGWRAGLTHDVSAAWRLHASASQRSRFPALRELYSGALDRFLPNPDLRPETLLGLEGGVTMDRRIGFVPDATLQINAFHHRLRDAVVRTTLPAPDRRFYRVNRDRIVSTGMELLAGAAFGSHRDRAVTISGDALVQRISVIDQSSPGIARHAENNPEVRGMLELGVPLVAGIRGFANARYTGRQYCLNADTGNEMMLEGKSEANFAVERRFVVPGTRGGVPRAVRALLALDNAGNAAVYDQCGLPQPGRTLRLMFSFQ